MYLLITIRHNIFIQCHGNHIVVEKRLYYMLENDILRNYFPNKLGVLRGDFGVVWVSKRCPDAPCLQLQVPVISLKVNDILRNYFPKRLGVLRGDILGGGECLKDAQTPCWLRLCLQVPVTSLKISIDGS